MLEQWIPLPQIPEPQVWLIKSRLIRIDRLTADDWELTRAKSVDLYCERDTKRIGILPRKDRKGKCRVRVGRTVVSIHAPQFFRDFGIEAPGARLFSASRDAGSALIIIHASEAAHPLRPAMRLFLAS